MNKRKGAFYNSLNILLGDHILQTARQCWRTCAGAGQALSRALAALREDMEAARAIRLRIVDQFGRPIYSQAEKVGDTITVKRPRRYISPESGADRG